jgi:hypothetical protein
MDVLRSARISSIVLALAPMLLASCRVTTQSIANSQESRDYHRLEIIYRAHPALGPLLSPSATNIVQASAQVPADPFQNMTWSQAELRIECPHPNGRADMARVTLHLCPVECGKECERKSWGQQMEDRVDLRHSRQTTFRERLFYGIPAPRDSATITELDLPKSELNAILEELNSHGFFAEQSRSADSESQLEVRLNRRWTSRRWGYEPSLDALTTRVYEEGITRTTADHNVSTDHRPFARIMPFGRSK